MSSLNLPPILSYILPSSHISSHPIANSPVSLQSIHVLHFERCLSHPTVPILHSMQRIIIQILVVPAFDSLHHITVNCVIPTFECIHHNTVTCYVRPGTCNIPRSVTRNLLYKILFRIKCRTRMKL